MGYFSDNHKVFELLPRIYAQGDSATPQKDVGFGAEGQLSRFCRVLESALDEDKTLIDDLLYIQDVDKTASRFLPYLANFVGLVVRDFSGERYVRKQIKYAVRLYKIKGSRKSLTLALRNVGVKTEIEELYWSGALKFNGSWKFDGFYKFGDFKLEPELNNKKVSKYFQIKLDVAEVPVAAGYSQKIKDLVGDVKPASSVLLRLYFQIGAVLDVDFSLHATQLLRVYADLAFKWGNVKFDGTRKFDGTWKFQPAYFGSQKIVCRAELNPLYKPIKFNGTHKFDGTWKLGDWTSKVLAPN